MGRAKKEGGVKRVSLSLSNEQVKLITRHTVLNKMRSESEFMGWLIEAYDNTTDPIKELRNLNKEEESIKEKLKEIETRKSDMLNRIEYHKDKEKLKEEKIIIAISYLKEKILDRATSDAVEELARYWAFKLNKDPYELIYRAGKEIKNAQI